MQVGRHPERGLGVRQADGQAIAHAEPLVGFDQRDQLSEHLGDVGAVDLVDDQDMAFGRPRPAPVVAGRHRLFKTVPIHMTAVHLVDRDLAQLLIVDLLAGQAFVAVPEPANRPAMVVFAVHAGHEPIGSGDFADRTELAVAVGDDDQRSDLHVDAEGEHLRHVRVVAAGVGMILPPPLLDRVPLIVARIGPVDVAAPAEDHIALANGFLVDEVVT